MVCGACVHYLVIQCDWRRGATIGYAFGGVVATFGKKSLLNFHPAWVTLQLFEGTD